MNCKNCGAVNNEGNAFCSSCGTKLETIVTETPEVPVQPVEPVAPVVPAGPVVNQAPANNKSKVGIIGLIIALVAVILILVAVVVLFATGILSFGKKTTNGGGGTTPSTPVVTEKTYELGDAVTTVDGSKWHVIAVKGDNVTLLLDELVVEETGYGKSAAEEDQKYANSLVKQYIDETYMPELSTKIDAAGGNSSKVVGRILSMDDYLSITYSEFDDNYYTTGHTLDAFEHKEEVCKMSEILALTKSFWTSSNVRDYNTTGSYFGVLYVKIGAEKYSSLCSKNMPDIYAIVDIATDSSYQMGSTLIGIRPVIETPKSNLK